MRDTYTSIENYNLTTNIAESMHRSNLTTGFKKRTFNIIKSQKYKDRKAIVIDHMNPSPRRQEKKLNTILQKKKPT